ncbi:class I SAM-dependent methyltransferase [Calothrix sp. 336/3]|uniref:class I SAM-dependent methyltransferase n=1 Tax=Calothrix sp. 336/3 TaxID=1337936 RepID=UPI0004E2CB3D|nr:class I SAM-dependent methyltransferase [Calothrix sp. 336/3]AKG24127.1 methyltransferase type 12 [Calothrix sp. 336/3]
MPDTSPSQKNTLQRDWSAYYNAVADRPPRQTLLTAIELRSAEAAIAKFQQENNHFNHSFAVDLGCGDGRDTIEILNQGWQVLAIDAEPEAIQRLTNRPQVNLAHLETQIVKFEDLNLPQNIDLINASFSLPFCLPQSFPILWQKIVNSLRPGGRFCGQLFGEQDSWAIGNSINYHTYSQIISLLEPFDIEFLEEEKHPGVTALGDEKYWHIFHIVVKKRSE